MHMMLVLFPSGHAGDGGHYVTKDVPLGALDAVSPPSGGGALVSTDWAAVGVEGVGPPAFSKYWCSIRVEANIATSTVR